jgi:hypothetical protein
MTGTMTGTHPFNVDTGTDGDGRGRAYLSPLVMTRTRWGRAGTALTGTERPPSLEGVPVLVGEGRRSPAVVSSRDSAGRVLPRPRSAILGGRGAPDSSALLALPQGLSRTKSPAARSAPAEDRLQFGCSTGLTSGLSALTVKTLSPRSAPGGTDRFGGA